MRRSLAVPALALAVVLAACGGGSSNKYSKADYVGAAMAKFEAQGAPITSRQAECFIGQVVAIHPSAVDLHGVRAYPSIGAVPVDVDLAVIVVPAADVEGEVDHAADHLEGLAGPFASASGGSSPFLLAQELSGRIPVIYAPAHLESVAVRWKMSGHTTFGSTAR